MKLTDMDEEEREMYKFSKIREYLEKYEFMGKSEVQQMLINDFKMILTDFSAHLLFEAPKPIQNPNALDLIVQNFTAKLFLAIKDFLPPLFEEI